MEQVIRTYGMFILEAAVFTGLIWLIFRGITDDAGNQGIFSIAGSGREEISVPHLDFTCYQSESEKETPVIQYIRTGMLYVGEYSQEELLSAHDYRGQSLSLELCSVSDVRGIDRTREVCTESGGLRFESPGVYTLKVQAVDAWNRIAVCKISGPVNGGMR